MTNRRKAKFYLAVKVLLLFVVVCIITSALIMLVVPIPPGMKVFTDVRRYGGSITRSGSRLSFSNAEIDFRKPGFRQLLLHVSECCKVSTLWLDESSVDDSALDEFLHIFGEHLVSLRVADTAITDRALVPIAESKNLAYLSLMNTQVMDKGLKRLEEHTSLINLELAGTQITDAGMEYLKNLTAIEYLTLDRTRISNVGMVYLGRLTHLRELSLDDTDVTNDGLSYLKPLVNLKRLSLEGTHITSEGLIHLKPLVDLEWLSLEGTQVTDVESLYEYKKLRVLDLYRTGVSRKGLSNLRSHLPHTTIFFSDANGGCAF